MCCHERPYVRDAARNRGPCYRESVLVVLWSEDEVFNRKWDVRDKLVPEYNNHIDHLVKFMQRWRYCILIGPGVSQCCGVNPGFDEIMQKYTQYFGERAAPRMNRRSSTRGSTSGIKCTSALPTPRSRQCPR